MGISVYSTAVAKDGVVTRYVPGCGPRSNPRTSKPSARKFASSVSGEGTRRGVYAGALGYVGFDGALDTCIALRTIVMRDGVALLQAGAGVVADSDPASEYVECINKLAALSAAIDLAETGRYGR